VPVIVFLLKWFTDYFTIMSTGKTMKQFQELLK